MGSACCGKKNNQNQPQCCQPLPQGQGQAPQQPQFIAVPLPPQQPPQPPIPSGPQIAPFAFQVQLQPRTC